MELEYDEKQKIFMETEKKFTDFIHKQISPEFSKDLNYCCSDEEESDLIKMGNFILQVPEYSELSLNDLYLVLIFVYYSLNLNEQTSDPFKTSFINNMAVNKSLSKKLYFDITAGNIKLNGQDLSSAIRRYIFGLAAQNGGKKQKNTKNIKNNTNIYMTKTPRKKTHNKTHKNNKNSSLGKFQKDITVIFLEILMMVKLYHWKTTSYSTHKATDELYSSLNGHIDTFIEVLLGKSETRTNLMSHKTIKLMDLNSVDSLKREIDSFKTYLVNLEKHIALKNMTNSDLFNIRDEILADLNKFLYLLTLK